MFHYVYGKILCVPLDILSSVIDAQFKATKMDFKHPQRNVYNVEKWMSDIMMKPVFAFAINNGADQRRFWVG